MLSRIRTVPYYPLRLQEIKMIIYYSTIYTCKITLLSLLFHIDISYYWILHKIIHHIGCYSLYRLYNIIQFECRIRKSRLSCMNCSRPSRRRRNRSQRIKSNWSINVFYEAESCNPPSKRKRLSWKQLRTKTIEYPPSIKTPSPPTNLKKQQFNRYPSLITNISIRLNPLSSNSKNTTTEK